MRTRRASAECVDAAESDPPEDPGHPTVNFHNGHHACRDRLLSGDVAAAFFDAVQAHARAAGLLSDEHFTVDGTQLEAWASLKSFRCGADGRPARAVPATGS